jgi:hypothetical protein
MAKSAVPNFQKRSISLAFMNIKPLLQLTPNAPILNSNQESKFRPDHCLENNFAARANLSSPKDVRSFGRRFFEK